LLKTQQIGQLTAAGLIRSTTMSLGALVLRWQGRFKDLPVVAYSTAFDRRERIWQGQVVQLGFTILKARCGGWLLNIGSTQTFWQQEARLSATSIRGYPPKLTYLT